MRAAVREAIFSKGQSKRLWGELYKVIDASDVVVQVLDARDPMGTYAIIGLVGICLHVSVYFNTQCSASNVVTCVLSHVPTV